MHGQNLIQVNKEGLCQSVHQSHEYFGARPIEHNEMKLGVKISLTWESYVPIVWVTLLSLINSRHFYSGVLPTRVSTLRFRRLAKIYT